MGSIDIFGGAKAIGGANNFQVDYNPLEQIGFEVGKLPPAKLPDISEYIETLIELLFSQTNINLATPEELWGSIQHFLTEIQIDLEQFQQNLLQFLTDLTGIDFIAINEQSETFLGQLVQHLGGITQLDFSSPQAFFESIQEFFEQIQIDFNQFNEHILQLLTDATGIDFIGINNNLHNFWSQLFGGIESQSGLNLSSPESLWSSIGHLLTSLIATIFQAPNPGSISQGDLIQWILDTVFGIVPPDRIPVLPISHLTDSAVNLLSNPMFTGDSPISTLQAGMWTLDSTVSQSGVGGSARVEANGATHDLYSTDLIPVKVGQAVELSGWVKTDSLVTVPGAVFIGVACYKTVDGSGEPVSRPVMQITQTGTTDWQKWSGTYTAEEGVASIRYLISVGKQATSGSVWFDNLFLGKNGILQVDWVNGLGDQLTATAEWLTQISTDLQLTWNAWMAALTGRPQEQATPQLTAEQIAELLATTAANTTALNALQTAIQGGLTNLVASGDDFERDSINPSGRPDMWSWIFQRDPSIYGGYGLYKGQMVWVDKGNQGNQARFLRVDPADGKTKTAYQRVARVTGTYVAEAGIPLLGYRPAVDTIYARVSDDFSKYLVLLYDGDGNVRLRYNVGAGEKDFDPPAVRTVSKPTAGASYALECGDPADLRSYRVLRNNTAVLSVEDVAGVTAPLDNFRGWGWGGEAVPRGLGQGTPSSVHSVTIADIPPSPTIGSYLEITRTASGSVNKPAGELLLPTGTFNQLVRNSPDVTFDTRYGTQVILIAKPGPYTLSTRITTEIPILGFDEWELLLYRITGTAPTQRWLLFRSGQVGSPGAAIGETSVNSIEATFQFYSAGVNQQYALGFSSKNPEKIVGNANGDSTWLTITRGA